jgi:hypothetical protein
METKILKISEIKLNPNNPRLIKDDKFEKLVNSIKEFPEMLKIRPIVVNKDMIILGGNMRFKACREAGLKEIPVIIANELTSDQEREFLIKDNVSGGEWDWNLLNDWDKEELNEWGLDVWEAPAEVDYSILDDDDLDEQLEDMTNGVKKAIQIEFEAEHYEEASELVKFWRQKEAYIGGMIMEYLKAEKEKL